MPDLTTLQKYLKVDICQPGELIQFIDGGTITENKEFRDKKTGETKYQTVFEITVLHRGQTRIYSPNSASLKLLQTAFGTNSDEWVGRKGIVSIAEQIQFGELKPVLIIKPYGGPAAKTGTSGKARGSKTQPEANPQGEQGTVGGAPDLEKQATTVDPADIQFDPNAETEE